VTERVALVAGGSSDIGRAIVFGLARHDASVFALGRDPGRLKRVAGEHGGRVQPIVADLTCKSNIVAVRDQVVRGGRLDILVLASGIYDRSSDPDALERQFAANVQGPYALLRALLPLLIGSKGLVVFINSRQGLSASRGVGHFAATQHAMRALADSLREELNPEGVRITSIFLGRTATARQAAIFEMEQRPYVPETLIQPRDVADLVVALAMLPTTSEVTDITVRPGVKSY
jgi:NAD(P)-dependent dehydrogenase (short-subunit alcohol dehydrogenase family)